MKGDQPRRSRARIRAGYERAPLGGSHTRNVRCFYMRGNLGPRVENWDDQELQARTGGEAHKALMEKWMGSGDKVLRTEEGAGEDCVTRLF